MSMYVIKHSHQQANFQWNWNVNDISFPFSLQSVNQPFRNLLAGLERVRKEIIFPSRFHAVLQHPFCVRPGHAVTGLGHRQKFKHLQRRGLKGCSRGRNERQD